MDSLFGRNHKDLIKDNIKSLFFHIWPFYRKCLTTTGIIDVYSSAQPIAMISYYPTLAVIASAGFSSFRELYRKISNQGCQHDEYYTIVYVDRLGIIKTLIVPVWRVMLNSMQEISNIRKRR